MKAIKMYSRATINVALIITSAIGLILALLILTNNRLGIEFLQTLIAGKV